MVQRLCKGGMAQGLCKGEEGGNGSETLCGGRRREKAGNEAAEAAEAHHAFLSIDICIHIYIYIYICMAIDIV